MQLLIVLAIVPLGFAFGYAMAMAEMKATADLMTAKKITAQLAVLAARRSRPRVAAGGLMPPAEAVASGAVRFVAVEGLAVDISVD